MSATVKNPEVLNDLLQQILLGLLDQAQGEFEDRTGKTIKVTRLQKMKLDLAKKLVKMGLDQLNRFGDPHARFEMVVKLSNEHLPKVVEIVGEDAVIARLQKLPKDVRDRDVVLALEQAGATEVADLLRKALPAAEAAATVRTIPAAPAAAEPVGAAEPEAAAPVADTRQVSAPFSEAAAPEPVEVTAPVNDAPAMSEDELARTLAVLKGQLGAMERLQARTATTIDQLRTNIAAIEELGKPANDKAPVVTARPAPGL